MSRAHRFTPDEDDRLRRLWASGEHVREIARRLGRSRQAVTSRIERLALPPRNEGSPTPRPVKPSAAELRRAHRRKVAELKHRFSLGFGDPIVVRPPPANAAFGFPLKELDAETRFLIDDALWARAQQATNTEKQTA
jgi:hypothetical protein